jgi:alpha-beta hydrolase superfamily lysophospholipase
MNVLDHPEVLQVLFHPRREEIRVLRPFDVRQIGVEVESGLIVGGRLYPAGSKAPAILYFHGNGEIAADYDHIAPLYTQMGITLLVMDHRGYGRSDGTPTARSLLVDAVTAFDAVSAVFEDNGLAPAQLIVMGRSLGSAAAIEVALHAGGQLGGLIIESGFADIFALLARLGVRVHTTYSLDEDRDGFGNPAKMARVTTRTLVIHGQADVLIPPSDGQELYRRCAAPDKRLVLIPGAGHNNLMMVGMSRYFEAIQVFVLGDSKQKERNE